MSNSGHFQGFKTGGCGHFFPANNAAGPDSGQKRASCGVLSCVFAGDIAQHLFIFLPNGARSILLREYACTCARINPRSVVAAKSEKNGIGKKKDTARITAHCAGTMMCNICFVQCLNGTMPHLRTNDKMVGFNMYPPNPASRGCELHGPRRYQAADFETLHRL